jgi:twitching motility protein PilT
LEPDKLVESPEKTQDKLNIKILLEEMINRNASDLHLRVGYPPVLRIDGELIDLSVEPLTIEIMDFLCSEMMQERHITDFETSKGIDFAFGIEKLGRFRTNIFKQKGTRAVAIRSIPVDLVPFDELMLPEILKELALKPRGLILVTGITGSGKSTTLAAMIQHINDNLRKHIITVEDPIEFLHIDRKSVINQREVGVDTPSYTTALRHILRQDPDVILLGEIRDSESMEIALQAADTGHLVFSTLHTADTTQTIGRIISFFPPHQHQEIRLLVASNLRAIISMRLIQRADDRGRVPACEVLINSEAVKDCIVDPVKTSSIRKLIQDGHVRYGMQIFDQSLMKLYKSGLITYEEAMYNSSNPTEFSLRVKGISGTSDKAWDDFDNVQEGSTEEGEDV